MDKYVIRSKSGRKRSWTTDSTTSLPSGVLSDDLNSNQGKYSSKRIDLPRGDIRSYANKDPVPFLQATKWPLLRRHIDYRWIRKESQWMIRQDFCHFVQSRLQISTSFQQEGRRDRVIEIANTRTADLEFSSDSSLLAVGSGGIQGGYVSVIKTSSFHQSELVINPLYNSERNASVVQKYPDPVLSLRWVENDSSLLVTRRGCREVSLFNCDRIQNTVIASMPCAVDHIMPCEHSSTCYVVALGNGVLRLIDCREPQRFSTTWALEYTQRRSIGCMTFGETNEVVFTYKHPNTLNIVDLRKTNYSSVTGKKTPVLLSSATLTCACPLSLDPSFIENEMLCSLADGRSALLHKYLGCTRLLSVSNTEGENYEWDGVITRPFRPCFVSPTLYVASPVKQSTNLRIQDYGHFVFGESEFDDFHPSYVDIPCSWDVYGCSYSPTLHTFVVSCGGDLQNHHLVLLHH